MAKEDTTDKTPTNVTNQDTNDVGTDSGDKSASDSTELKLDTSDLDPDLAKIVEEKVKGFQADYTRKTQALSKKEKEMLDKVEKGDYWEKWHSENKAGIESYNKWLEDQQNKPSSNSDDSFSDTADDVFGDAGVKKAIAETARTKKELEDQMKSGFNMLVDLVDVKNRDEFADIKVDAKKVVKYAFENNITDMVKAVKQCYSDDLREKDFAKRLEEEKAKWEEQQKTNVLSVNMPVGRTTRKVIARNRR